MRIFDRTRGLERGFAKSHVTKREKEIFKGISFLGNYISSERQHRDGYGNSKFPFLEICVTLEFREKIYITMKRRERRIRWSQKIYMYEWQKRV